MVAESQMIKTVDYLCRFSRVFTMKRQLVLMSKFEVFHLNFSSCLTLNYCFSYQLSSSGIYKIPLEPTKENSVHYVNGLPLTPEPEVFGLHENADISRNNRETDMVSH